MSPDGFSGFLLPLLPSYGHPLDWEKEGPFVDMMLALALEHVI